MLLGCAWYPEHWDESRWDEDLRLMREAGITMVRMAEFAWSRLEPEEGRFVFDWLDRAVALAARRDIVTILGTPTAAPPAWLTQRYPETLAVREDGHRATHGARCHYAPTSARYRECCRRIAEEMAKQFGANPHVIGWQIDNEYGSVSYDEDTRAQFQQWLREQYQTLDNLNARWTTAYWSQEYSDWSQIPLPVGGHNPGLRLEFRRFNTHVYRTFQRVQIDAIRKYATPEQPITHNFMGLFDLFDYYELSEDLDIASWDSYVGSGHLQFLDNGATHDLTRGLKGKNFWLLETQPGFVNWCGVNNALDRGEVRTMAWHAVGHGADIVSYWQWRSALNGQEQYHGSLVAPDGTPRPLYAEVAQVGEEFSRVSDLLHGTTPAAEVAFLHGYADRWAIDFQRHHRDYDPVRYLQSFYRPLRAMGFDADIVKPTASLANYPLVIAPILHLLDDALAARLTDYVRGGGHLVLGARSGVKDDANALLPSRQPGPLAALLGGHVEEFYALDQPVPVAGPWGTGEASIWAEWLRPDAKDVEVLLSYTVANGWLDGQPAMISRRIDEGRITYVGAWFDDALMRRVLNWMTHASALRPVFTNIPEGVEICRRSGNGKDVFLVINHAARPCQVPLPRPMRDMLTGNVHRQWATLPARELVVLVWE